MISQRSAVISIDLEAALSPHACLRDQSQTSVPKSINSFLTVTTWVGELQLTVDWIVCLNDS